MAAGDVLAQQLVERRGKSHDIRRTVRMGVVGLGLGCILRPWYLTLDRIVKGNRNIDALKKMVIDQSIAAPNIILSFYTMKEVIEGKSFEEYKQTLKERYLETLKTNYKFWPFVQTVNFLFVPLQHRLGFVNVSALFWNTYLSWMAFKPSTETQFDIDLDTQE